MSYSKLFIKRVIAWLLFGLFLTGLVTSGGGSFYAYEKDMYQQPYNYYSSSDFEVDAQNDLRVIYDIYSHHADSARMLDDKYGPDKTNLVFEIYEGGEIAYSNRPDFSDYTGCLLWNSDQSDRSIEIRYLLDGLTVNDGYARTSRFNQLIFRNRYNLPVIALIMLICLIVDVNYLIRLAGHQENSEEIKTSFFDYIPLDLLALIMVVGLYLMGVIIDDTIDYVWTPVAVILGILAVVFAGYVLLILLLSFATRFKKGGWYRNTVTYGVLLLLTRLISMIFRFLTEILSGLPYMLKGLLLLIIMGGFTVLSFHNPVFALPYALIGLYLVYQWGVVCHLSENLAKGRYEEKVNTRYLLGSFKKAANNISSLSEGMNLAVEEKMKAERLKTELITNVSHDIKTPLTSILSYTDLLKNEENAEKQAEYLEVVERQGQRLKKLTEDIVEISKVSTGNIPVDLQKVKGNTLIEQILAEYQDKLAEKQLTPIVKLNSKTDSILADSRLVWRVIDNCFSNVVKYSQPDSRVYIDSRSNEDWYTVTIKNISNQQLNISVDELMERFVKGDVSRYTEGSGLGLNIARSLTELMKGKFSISIDGDLFKSEISLPIYKEN